MAPTHRNVDVRVVSDETAAVEIVLRTRRAACAVRIPDATTTPTDIVEAASVGCGPTLPRTLHSVATSALNRMNLTPGEYVVLVWTE